MCRVRRAATTTSVRSATHWRVSAGYLWHAQQAEHSPHGRPAHSGQQVDWFTTTAYCQTRARGQPPQGLELTTSAALLVTGFIGVLAGQGHTFTPVTVAIATAALLACKERLAGFSLGLTETELRSAILLAILAFIVYPISQKRRSIRGAD